MRWLSNQRVYQKLEKGVAYVNYLKQLLAFNQRQLLNPLSQGQVVLWHALMSVNNDCAWIEWFTVANSRLKLFTQLSISGIYKARNELIRQGLIEVKLNHGKATSYKIIKLYDASNAPSNAPSKTLNKQNKTKQNKTKLNKIKIKNIKKDEAVDTADSTIKFSKTNQWVQEFNQLWELYPKKARKADAQKAYIKARKSGTTEEQVRNGIQSYVDYLKKTNTQAQFIAQGGTWFNQQRWLDDYQTPSYHSGMELTQDYLDDLPF